MLEIREESFANTETIEVQQSLEGVLEQYQQTFCGLHGCQGHMVPQLLCRLGPD